MTKRYAIVARDYRSGERVEVCSCDSNPENMERAVRNMRRKGKHAYLQVRIVDREAPQNTETPPELEHTT